MPLHDFCQKVKHPFLGVVKKAALALPDAPNFSEIVEITFIDELQTFVGKKIQIRVMHNSQPFPARHLRLGSGRSRTRLARKL
ncbi:hypothetical protein QUA74_18335 [Microcoleus sp. LAD1_D3]|uniref:hypothetical protein n=1 Tax=Microcoleus sp. LAD1_D3 TaxID=2819365 RepID=UPI002FCF201A